jgi:hypothetical protein
VSDRPAASGTFPRVSWLHNVFEFMGVALALGLNSEQDQGLLGRSIIAANRLENFHEPTNVMNLKHRYLHGSPIY